MRALPSSPSAPSGHDAHCSCCQPPAMPPLPLSLPAQFTFHQTSDNFTGTRLEQINRSNEAVAALYAQLASTIQSTIAAATSDTADLTEYDRRSVSRGLTPLLRPPRRRVRAYIDGCYDLLHSGHYNAIRQAHALCDELVLGIHSDAEIQHHKGPPVMNDTERVIGVKACKWIDAVVFGVPYDPTIELLDQLGCDFCVHGDDPSYTATGEDAFAAVKAVGRMRTVKRTEGISTTDLVRRLLRIGTATSVDAAAEHSGNGQPSVPTTVALSSFLPLSFRLSQFSNNRLPSVSDICVLIVGDFDLFHAGHIQLLEQCRALGSFLYVGVLGDEHVRHHKGPHFPIMSVYERALNVLACRHVDEVIIDMQDDITNDTITTLNIGIVVRPQYESGADFDARYRHPTARNIVTSLTPSNSLTTEAVVARILDNQSKYQARNSKRAVKEADYFGNKAYVQELSNGTQQGDTGMHRVE